MTCATYKFKSENNEKLKMKLDYNMSNENNDQCNVSSSEADFNQRQKLQQLFTRIVQEVERQKPSNVIFFIVDFLCKNYPKHLASFASIWNGDPDLEKEKLQVVEFFRFQKLPVDIATQFTNAGYDTLETLCTIVPDALEDIEKFNQTQWLPGHRVRLQQTFADIVSRVRAYRQEKEKMLHIARLTSGHCDHPIVVTRTNAPPPLFPAISVGPKTIPHFQSLPINPAVATVIPPQVNSVPVNNTGSRPFIVTPMN